MPCLERRDYFDNDYCNLWPAGHLPDLVPVEKPAKDETVFQSRRQGPLEAIARLVGEEAGFLATATAAVLGAVTLIPALISFPLAASLLRSGATVTTIAAFITTLVMVGFVTAPMEIKALGKKFTLLRNGLSFIAALIIAGLMGVILG